MSSKEEKFVSPNFELCQIQWIILWFSHDSLELKKSVHIFSSNLHSIAIIYSSLKILFLPLFTLLCVIYHQLKNTHRSMSTWSEWKEKTDLVDNEEEDSVSFDMKNSFIFRPDLTEKASGLKGNERITIPHLLIMVSGFKTLHHKLSYYWES